MSSTRHRESEAQEMFCDTYRPVRAVLYGPMLKFVGLCVLVTLSAVGLNSLDRMADTATALRNALALNIGLLLLGVWLMEGYLLTIRKVRLEVNPSGFCFTQGNETFEASWQQVERIHISHLTLGIYLPGKTIDMPCLPRTVQRGIYALWFEQSGLRPSEASGLRRAMGEK